jgi:branched-chain amino acid transport system substrate-binding protein
MDHTMRTTKPWIGMLAIGLVLALTAVACGGRDDDSSSGGGGANTTADGGGSGFTIDTSNCSGYEATQGVTDTAIKFGSSFPQSGTYSAFAKISVGYEAYFDYINDAQGGVNGRQIEMITMDDNYETARTQSNTNQLVQSDGVFSMYNVVGTPNNLAIRDDLGDQCIPNLYAGTGSQKWGETEAYPWMIGSIPAYPTEAAIFADYLKANKPDATVAILKQNDDFGEGYVEGFKAATEGTNITIVDEQTYNPTDPDVKTQINTLAASGADTALLATTALKCIQAINAMAESQWDPTVYVSATCTSKTIMGNVQAGAGDGFLSAIYLMDPADPQWDSNSAMQEFQTLGAQYGISAEDLDNGIVGYGWTMGALLVETLKQTGEITRQSVMQTAYSLDNLELGLLLPGITINTNGEEDPFPIEQMQIGQYNGQYWELQGDIVSFEGKTGEYVGS